MTFRITVKTLTDQIINFKNVSEYSITDGYLTFTDTKTGLTKRFPQGNCEIEEEKEPTQEERPPTKIVIPKKDSWGEFS